MRGFQTDSQSIQPPPTLDDFWAGRARWILDIPDVGLPVGESDSLARPDGEIWSYLHASTQSAGIRDTCGDPVPFPGCVTRWTSTDGGRQFGLSSPTCLTGCLTCPCLSERDHTDQQQYPRVVVQPEGQRFFHTAPDEIGWITTRERWLMAYEWQGRVQLAQSADGLHWDPPREVPGSREWYRWWAPCAPWEAIGIHPFVNTAFEYECLAGGPPGLIVAGDQLTVFMGFGKNPGHMGCYAGDWRLGAASLHKCYHNPLFTGAATYGPLDLTGPAANPYFDFRTVTSADVLPVGDRYYMTYEGVRGPSQPNTGDSQFNLGFARSLGSAVDGPWEKYPGNPVLLDVPGNVGVGHADLLVVDGVTVLYTATSDRTRGRYVLTWR